jgi:hypothetical protein
MPTKTRNRRITEKRRTIKNKKEKLNFYRLNNPWHDILIYNLKNGIKVSESQKKVMRSIIEQQKKKGKNCFKEANSNKIIYFSSIDKYL